MIWLSSPLKRNFFPWQYILRIETYYGGFMKKEEILEVLINFITHNFMVDRADVNFEKSLIDEGIIDSFGLVEIASFMEAEFCMVVEDDDMNRDNFGSVLKIVDYIHRQNAIDEYKRAVE